MDNINQTAHKFLNIRAALNLLATYRESARGGAGGVTAPPIFQDLVKEWSPKIAKKKFPFIGGSPNFKFLTPSLATYHFKKLEFFTFSLWEILYFL